VLEAAARVGLLELEVLQFLGSDPFIAAGPIMACALPGAGCWRNGRRARRRAVGLGIPEYEAKRYEGRVKVRRHSCFRFIATIRNGPRKAKEILEDAGGEDVSSTGEGIRDYAKSDRPMLRNESSPNGPHPRSPMMAAGS
jgi:hypothetical protein